MALNGGEIISYLSLDTSKYSSAMQAALSDLGVFADRSATGAQRAQAFGSALTTVGTRMTLGITMPVIGAGVAVSKAAIDYETAFAGVRKTVDATEQEFAALSDTILRMSTDTPVAATELAAIMESAGQLGVKTQNLEKFTKTMADLAVATNLTSDEAATMLAQYANVTGMDLTNIDRLGSVIVALGNNTATTERDITELAQRLSGMASTVGLTDAEVMGLAATMASLGINAEAGGSAMSRVMQKAHQAITAGGKSLDQWAKAANVSAAEFSAAWKRSPVQALNMLLSGLRSVKDAGGDVYAVLAKLGLNDMRITDTLLRLLGAGDDLVDNIQLANDAWSQNTALTAEAEQRYATTESQLQLTKNSIQRLAVSLGNSLLPYVRRGAEFVANLSDRFAQLDESTQRTILTVVALVAAIGPATTLIGGLISLLSGPAGIVVAAGLAAGAIYAVVEATKRDQEAKVLKDLETRFGNIKLSAEEIKTLISTSLGTVTMDTAALDAAREKLSGAKNSVTALSRSVAAKITLAHLRAETAEVDGLPAQMQGLIEQVQGVIDEEQNACILTIAAHFGENGPTGGSIIGDLNAYFEGLNGEFAAKGKELRKALDDAIADGIIDDEEAKTIARLQAELMEIASRASLIESQTEQDMLKLRYGDSDLSAETLQEISTAIGEYVQNETEKADRVYYDTMKILYNLHHAGALSDEEHPDWTQDQILEARADAAKDAWSTRLGQLDAEAIDLGWELVGRRIREAYDPEIKEYEKALDAVSKSGNQADAYDYYFGEDRKKDLTAAESANNMLESSGWLLKRLAFMQDTLGDETPQEYTEMLGELGQIQDWIFGMRSLKATKDSHSGGGFATSDDEGAVAEWLKNAKFTKIRREPEKEPTFIKSKVIGKATEESMQIHGEGLSEDVSGLGIPIKATVPVEVTPDYVPADEEEELSADALGIPKTPIETTVPVEVTPEYMPADEEEELSADALGIPQTPIETKIPVEIKADASSKQNAHAAGEQLADTAADGADGHQSEFADAGANAAKAFADALSSGSKTASAAGSALAFSAVTAVRTLLKIHSPSQVMLELGEYTAGGYTAGLNAGIPGVTATVSKLGAAVLDGMSLTAKEGESFAKGYMKGVLKAAEKTPVNKAKAPEEPAETPRPQNQSFAVSRQAEQPLLDNSDEHATAFRRMMELVGASSVWYQDSLLDQALAELQNKYDQLLAAAKDGNEAYKNQLQESLKKETEAIKKEYQLQQQIALDFLDVREQALRKELSEKREKARTDDYEKELADLQRRLRQTKSAREKRELQEEIDAMIRDEELRQEENRLSDISAGFSVFRKAIRQGVIGLGDLLADPSFGAMSIGYGGIASIPDISAAQLEAALAAMGGGYTGGNTYQIDLTGATVRDEDDIQRIVDAFEDRMREIQRGL